MRVTRFTDIGMRVLIYLSNQQRVGQDGPLVTVAEIAVQFDIPQNHLVKVVGFLAKLGMVEAMRGRRGGVRLGPEAPGARLGDLLRALEGDEELVDCEGLRCRLRTVCSLRGALAEGLNAFYVAMNRYTLTDIAGGATGEQIIRMHRQFAGSTPAMAVQI